MYIHQGYWPAIFFSCGILVWFWFQGNTALFKCVWKSFPFLFFFNDLCIYLRGGESTWLSAQVGGGAEGKNLDSSRLSTEWGAQCRAQSHDPPLLFFERVWEGLVLILLWMLGRIYQWSHLILDLHLLRIFCLLVNLLMCNWYIQILYFITVQFCALRN